MGAICITVRRGVRTLRWVLAATASALVGCGAKTGLEIPDASRDASADAARDAGLDAGPDAAIPCVEIPLDGGVVDLPLQTAVQVGRADVVFSIDTTASMQAEIDEIRENVRDVIAPAIARTIQDSQIGVTTFADFPEGSCGLASSDDLPFRMVLPVTDDLARVQTALDSIVLGNGGDEPESQVEALYQIATGEGFGRYVPPSFGCPAGGFGYPCFRRDALPVVLLFSDAPFHNGPGGAYPFANPGACPTIRPEPRDYADAVAALNAARIRVIGLYSGPPMQDGFRHLQRVASDTGAVDAAGQPIVFDIGQRGERLSRSVIDAIATLASVIEFDTIDTLLEDVDRSDDVDPRTFVEAVVPVRAEPMENVRAIDVEAGAFRGVLAGTLVVFRLRVRAGAVAPGVGPRRFLLEVVFRGDGRTRLGSTLVEIVVPGADGSGCEGSSSARWSG